MLDLTNIHKSYAGTSVLRGVSLRAAAGEVVALLGPSGCGKTTLLRIIAGLERADSGALCFEGRAIAELPAHRRGFGLMFQDYALFPHRDVAANVAFGLRMQRLPAPEIAGRVTAMLELVGLRAYEHRRVYELSGGERQRVALARALAPRPRLLMLDEPLAALDRSLRERLQDELATILRHVGVTSLYVTHDQQEAFALADRVALMNEGRVVQEGPPEALYRRPASVWGARFLGLSNIITGTYRGEGLVETGLGLLRCRADDLAVLRPGAPVTLVIYPDAAVAPGSPESGVVVRGVLVERQFRGRFYRVRLRHSSGVELMLELDAAPPATSVDMAVGLRAEGVYVLRAEG